MNTKLLLLAPLAAALLGISTAGSAATPAGNDASTMHNESRAMKGAAHEGGSSGMDMMRGAMQGGGGMMGGMMGSCPMMGGTTGANGKVMMQMHGEMMRAMGDIMIKYADKLETPAPSKLP